MQNILTWIPAEETHNPSAEEPNYRKHLFLEGAQKMPDILFST